MMRYLQADMLKDCGINHFDEWAADFGEVKTDYELKRNRQILRDCTHLKIRGKISLSRTKEQIRIIKRTDLNYRAA